MPDVSPTKWHRAHTTWFFETFLLAPRLDGYTPFDPDYGFLFNSYYETVGPGIRGPIEGSSPAHRPATSLAIARMSTTPCTS